MNYLFAPKAENLADKRIVSFGLVNPVARTIDFCYVQVIKKDPLKTCIRLLTGRKKK